MSFILPDKEDLGQLNTFVTYFCIFYTAACIVSRLILRFKFVSRKTLEASPIIKSVHFNDENSFIRKSLVAVNWSLVANKARALHSLKHQPCAPKQRGKVKASLSFTFGDRSHRSSSVHSRSEAGFGQRCLSAGSGSEPAVVYRASCVDSVE